ncbi:MFS transporter [Aquabacterium sp. OR-4]|uniref:MFS transporter n=1 Tax=Aquabacterium sp. OR-4 TaxID=2978127 RepID=UPI0021B1C482|nr:MFS transporter [Aquabacterium sp. OR-4]MDT7837696.1 MFS transporter [Aquabacterium sp. OR-4]
MSAASPAAPPAASPVIEIEPAYAWVVVWACFVALGVIFGVSYSFAAFFEPFALAFGAPRAQVALVFGLCGLIYFVGGAGGGLLADRFGPRRVCSAGMLCIAAGLLGASLAPDIRTVYLAYGGGVGLGIALVYTPSIACVQPWFTRRRGLAAGMASAGIGAGTVAVPLLAAAAIAAWQWRGALQALAVGVLVLGLGATLLLRRAPAATAQGGAAVAGHTLGQAVRSAAFRRLYLATLVAGPVMFVPFAHVSAAARDLGVPDARAVGLVGLIGIGSLVGRFVIGAAADRLGRPLTLALAQASLGLSYLVWWGASGYWAMAVFALWLGLSYGGMVSLMPALVMDLFGPRAVSAILGTLYSGAALGNLAGPWLAGAAFDAWHGYTPVIWVCLALAALGTLLYGSLVPRPAAVAGAA